MTVSPPDTGNITGAATSDNVVEAGLAVQCLTSTETKFTAAQIASDCPFRLQQIGREIAERLNKARKQNELADNHLIAVNELIAEAKELCDRGGFKKFRELFCPHLGQSQSYVLHAIGAGKKTLTEHRTEERERKQKTRANQRAAANSGTVPEKSEPQDAAIDAGGLEATYATMEPACRRPGIAPGDKALTDFTSIVMELIRRTANRKPTRFAATAVTADELATLGNYLSDLANLKKSDETKPRPIPAVPGDGMVSPEQSAEDLEVTHAAFETGGVT
jgi:hypothetical protein